MKCCFAGNNAMRILSKEAGSDTLIKIIINYFPGKVRGLAGARDNGKTKRPGKVIAAFRE
jgi:hypothetical protein